MPRAEASISFHNGHLPWILAILGIGFSVFISGIIYQHERAYLQNRFAGTTAAFHLALQSHLDAIIAETDSLKRFYDGSLDITPTEFAAFTKPVLNNHPYIQAMGWAPNMASGSDQELDGNFGPAHPVQHISSQHQLAADTVPDNTHIAHYPVELLEPVTGNETILGSDLYSNSVYYAALKLAQNLGETTLITDTPLFEENQMRTEIAIFIPAYVTRTSIATDINQQKELRGFVFNIFQLQTVFNAAIRDLSEDEFLIRIFDTSSNNTRHLLLEHKPHAYGLVDFDSMADNLYSKNLFQVGNHQWLMEFAPSPAYFNNPLTNPFWLAAIVFISGLSFSILLTAFVRIHQQRSQVLAELAEFNAKRLTKSEMQQNTIIDSMTDALITCDNRGIIGAINPAAESMFGYLAREIIGLRVDTLLLDEHQKQLIAYLSRFDIDSGHSNCKRQLLDGKHKNNNIIPLELTINAIRLDEQGYFLILIRDLSEIRYLDKMKNEFISVVSHELRTSIIAIRGALSLLESRNKDTFPPSAKQLVKISRNNTERLLLVVNDLLDIEALYAGRMTFKFATMEINNFIHKIITDCQSYAQQYNVEFSFKPTKQQVNVIADQERLKQVMENLLSNAAKFSPTNGNIMIHVERHDKIVRIQVSDHGPGIPKEMHEFIFDKFTQSDASDSRRIGGTGLGLNIAKSLIERHGGHIGLSSTIGKGSTFYFDLPITIDPMEAIIKKVPDNAPHILIVEDDHKNAEILQIMLARNGYAAHVSYHANQARELLCSNDYHALTLDIGLPGENGMELLKWLRSKHKTRDLPVIIISSTPQKKFSNDQIASLNILDWLDKPVDMKHAINALQQINQQLTKPRVLYVEDNPDHYQLVKMALQDRTNLIGAQTLDEARSILIENPIDLVLLDISVPDGNRLDLLDDMQKLSLNIPIIILTNQMPNEIVTTRSHGQLLKSSFDMNELSKTLDQFLTGKRIELAEGSA